MITLDTSVQPIQIANIVELYLKSIDKMTYEEKSLFLPYIKTLLVVPISNKDCS